MTKSLEPAHELVRKFSTESPILAEFCRNPDNWELISAGLADTRQEFKSPHYYLPLHRYEGPTTMSMLALAYRGATTVDRGRYRSTTITGFNEATRTNDPEKIRAYITSQNPDFVPTPDLSRHHQFPGKMIYRVVKDVMCQKAWVDLLLNRLYLNETDAANNRPLSTETDLARLLSNEFYQYTDTSADSIEEEANILLTALLREDQVVRLVQATNITREEVTSLYPIITNRISKLQKNRIVQATTEEIPITIFPDLMIPTIKDIGVPAELKRSAPRIYTLESIPHICISLEEMLANIPSIIQSGKLMSLSSAVNYLNNLRKSLTATFKMEKERIDQGNDEIKPIYENSLAAFRECFGKPPKDYVYTGTLYSILLRFKERPGLINRTRSQFVGETMPHASEILDQVREHGGKGRTVRGWRANITHGMRGGTEAPHNRD